MICCFIHIVEQKIIHFQIEEVNYNRDPCVNQFGIRVNTEFEKVNARVVPPPDLLYYQNRIVNVMSTTIYLL